MPNPANDNAMSKAVEPLSGTVSIRSAWTLVVRATNVASVKHETDDVYFFITT